MKAAISGLDSVQAMLDGINADLDAAFKAAAEAVADEAKNMCPVDTGMLRDSIEVSSEGMNASINAGADYAAFVEFGTCKAAAQPFLVPALLNSADMVISIICNAVIG